MPLKIRRPPRNTWERILGRLSRMNPERSNESGDRDRHGSQHSLPGGNIWPRGNEEVGPTDPQVYNGKPPAEDDPFLRLHVFTPSISNSIQQIFDEIQREESSDRSSVTTAPTTTSTTCSGSHLNCFEQPTYDYVPMHNRPLAQPVENGDSVRTPRPMHPLPQEHRGNNSSLIPEPSTSARETPNTPPRYAVYENHRPIPLTKDARITVPQQSPLVLCTECVTAEHSYCITNRPCTVWRHIHYIAREFTDTSIHCSRCYKLLLSTKRAIDCYQCRLYVIYNYRNIDHLGYKLMCDTTA